MYNPNYEWVGAPTGWRCPSCNKVFAPHISECPYCGKNGVVYTSGSTNPNDSDWWKKYQNSHTTVGSIYDDEWFEDEDTLDSFMKHFKD